MAKKIGRSDDAEKTDTDQLNIRISSALLDRLERIAESSGLKRSHHVIQAIYEYVLRHEQQPHQADQAKPERPPRR